MTFEEFFKKKRIDLSALEKAEVGLFSEFRNHFEQMGEKSFDHTKKYWFNKIRRLYPLAAEIKTERLRMENPLAEQTVTESLIKEGLPPKSAPKVGFTPRFKAPSSAPPKPAEEKAEPIENPPRPEITEQSTSPAPKLGFKPKFKAAAPPKTVEESAEEKPVAIPPPTAEPASPQPYKPRFKPQAPPKKADE